MDSLVNTARKGALKSGNFGASKVGSRKRNASVKAKAGQQAGGTVMGGGSGLNAAALGSNAQGDSGGSGFHNNFRGIEQSFIICGLPKWRPFSRAPFA